MIGNGEMKQNIINYISDNNLTKDVIMLEGITDIYNYYMNHIQHLQLDTPDNFRIDF